MKALTVVREPGDLARIVEADRKRLGAIGRGEGMAAIAVATVETTD